MPAQDIAQLVETGLHVYAAVLQATGGAFTAIQDVMLRDLVESCINKRLALDDFCDHPCFRASDTLYTTELLIELGKILVDAVLEADKEARTKLIAVMDEAGKGLLHSSYKVDVSAAR